MGNDWWNPNAASQQADPSAWWSSPSSGFFGDMATAPDTAQPQSSFFGNLFHAAGNVLHAGESVAKTAGSFFGGMVKGIASDAVQAVKTTKNIGQSVYESVEAPRQIKANQDFLKQSQAAYSAGQITLDELNRRYRQFQDTSQQIGSRVKNEGINTDKTSALGQGAAAANTFLNVATLGVPDALTALARGGARDIIETGAREGLGAGIKRGAAVLTSAGEDEAQREAFQRAIAAGGPTAARALAGNVAARVGEGVAFGGAQGALGTYTDPNGQSLLHNALHGALLAGALGGGGSLLDKDVRAGIGEVPGAVRQSISDYQALPQAVREGGYIRIPGSHAEIPPGNAAPLHAPIHDLSPADQAQMDLYHEVAASYSKPEQYVKDAVTAAVNFDKSARGGIIQSRPSEYGSGLDYSRTSEHSPFYRDYFAATGHAPSKAAYADEIRQALESGTDGHGLIDPKESNVYQLIKDNAAGTEALINSPEAEAEAARQAHLDALNGLAPAPAGPSAPSRSRTPAGLPARPGTGQLDINGQPFTAPAPGGNAMPAGLPKGPQGTAPLTGLEPEAGNLQPRYDDPRALQAALGKAEAERNPLIDYIDPRARAEAAQGIQGELATAVNPYEGQTANPNLLALGPGEAPAPLTPAQARRAVTSGKEAPADVLNVQKPGKKPIALGADVEADRNIATKQTPGGKVVPIATNNAHVTNDEMAAIRAIGEDGTAGQFKFTRTPEMNLEEALAKRGGQNSQEFKTLDAALSVPTREANGRISLHDQNIDQGLNAFIKKYGWDSKMDEDPLARKFMEAGTPEKAAEALQAFTDKYGDKAGQGLQDLKTSGTALMESHRADANQNIVRYAGQDRAIGQLENYWPRVMKQGTKGLRDWVLDLKDAGLSRFNGSDQELPNISSAGQDLNKITESTGEPIRQVNQAPLNSDLAKPNTSYLSQAQHRTATSPQGKQMGVLMSMQKYLKDVNRAGELTPVIAKGRSLQKAIELVNGETGNLRQMYDSFGDQINSIAGKTNRLDQVAVNSETGNKLLRVADKIQARASRSTILGSANSAMAQTLQVPLIATEAGPKNFAQGMGDTIKYALSKDKSADPASLSPFMQHRYPEYTNRVLLSGGQKAEDAATRLISKPFNIIEQATTKLAWYSNYRKAIAGGLEAGSKEAISEADRVTAKVIGERSAGNRAALYESKVAQPVTAYTLEVNQLYQMAKQYIKHDPMKAVALVGALWLYNQGYKSVTGGKGNMDPLQAGIDATRDLATGTDANGLPISPGERVARATGRFAGEAIGAMPIGDTIAAQLYPANGMHIPFAGGDKMLTRADVFGGTNLGRTGGGPPIASAFSNPLLLTGIPGIAQLQRSVEGVNAYNAGGSTTAKGATRFAISPSSENYLRALLWGQYGTKEGQEYLAGKNANIASGASADSIIPGNSWF